MAILHVATNKLICLSTDSKPTNVPVNYNAWETDTNKVYIYNGTSWRPTYRRSPASVNIFKEGGIYYAAEADGSIISSSSTDAAVPINAGIANMPDAVARGFGGRVQLFAEDYICLTGIVADREALTYHGVSLTGEGIGTRLIFEPTSTLTHGVHFRMSYAQIKDMLIWGKNANVVNLVKFAGPSGVGQHNWCVAENVSFNGVYSGIPVKGNVANTIFPTNQFPIAGQIGLLAMANHTADGWFTANHKVHNCEFFALDYGFIVRGRKSDMSNWSNLHCGSCNVGGVIEGLQHNFVNLRIEGGGGAGADQVGDIGLWIRKPPEDVGGNINMFENINIELHKLGGTGILLDDTVDNCQIGNLYYSSQDDMSKVAIVDNRKDVGTSSFAHNAQKLLQYTKGRSGDVHFGYVPQGKENGILSGNLKYQLDGVDTTFTTTGSINGPWLNMTTGTTLNSVACIYYNSPVGNNILSYQYPSFYVRFRANNTTASRFFIGIITSFASPPSTDTLPLANLSGIGLWLETQVSANWRIMHNDGAASPTVVDFPTRTLGHVTYQPTAVATNQVYNVIVSYNNANPSANVRLNGISYDYKTTGIPAQNGTPLGFIIYAQNRNAGGSRTLRLFSSELRIIDI